MADLATFFDHVQDVFHDAIRDRYWRSKDAMRHLADVGVRHETFAGLAERLTRSVVLPRIESVAGLFANAKVTIAPASYSVNCYFAYCDRFPVNSKVEYSLDHDRQCEELWVCCHMRMRPAFVRCTEQDRFCVPLLSVDEDALADWVEERLLEFVDTYLRIDTKGDHDNVSTNAAN